MCFLHFVEAIYSLLPVTNKRMNKKCVKSSLVGACLCSLNCVTLILLDNAHKTDDVAVVDFTKVNRLCTVLTDTSRHLDNVVGLEEGKSVAVLNVDNLNVADIVCNSIDERNSNKLILVAATLGKQSRLYIKTFVGVHFEKLFFDFHTLLCTALLTLEKVLELCVTAVIVLKIG